MTTMEERVSYLEGAHDHLATKADVADVKVVIANLESRLLRWMVGTVITGIAASVSAAFLVYRALEGGL